MFKLTDRQIEQINRDISLSRGEHPGACDSTLLGRIASSAYTLNKDENVYRYPTLYDKAAHIAKCLSKEKPFEKLNLKTAIVSCMTLLRVNEIPSEYSDDEIRQLASMLTSEKKNEKEISAWLNKKTAVINTDVKKTYGNLIKNDKN